jgi:hypothetical protein
MPSPVLQNENHIEVLRDLFDSGAIDLPRRIGIVTLKPTYFPVVLLSNSAKLDLPKSRAARAAIHGLDTVIKSEELRKRIFDSFDDNIRAVRAIPKLVGVSAIESIGRQLVALHRPATFNWLSKFGLGAESAPPTSASPPEPSAAMSASPECVECGRTLTEKVQAYLRDNAHEFRGQMLCYDCQRTFRRAKAKHPS